jgi:hypothetical protein
MIAAAIILPSRSCLESAITIAAPPNTASAEAAIGMSTGSLMTRYPSRTRVSEAAPMSVGKFPRPIR